MNNLFFYLGNYPNQHPGNSGLPSYTKQNRSLVDTDMVVWYIMGVTHDPRPEDFPVMPCAYLYFSFYLYIRFVLSFEYIWG